MQNKHHNIDQLFKSELSGIETTVPSFVKKDLDKKLFKKKRRFIFFFIITGLAIVTTTLFLFSQNKINSTAEITAETYLNENSNDKTNNSTVLKSNEINLSKNKEESLNTQTANQDKIISNTTTTIVTQSKTQQDKNDNIIHSSSLKKSNSTKKNKSNTNQLFQSTSHSTSKTKNNKSSNLKKQNKDDSTIDNSDSETNTATNQTKQEDEIDKSIDKTEKGNLKIDDNIVAEDKDSITDKDAKQNDIVEQENPKTDSTLNTPDSTKSIQPEDITNTPKPPKNNSFLMSLTGGLNINKSTYSDSVNGSNESNYYQTNNSENLGYSFNFEGNYLWKNKFLIGSGLGFSKQSFNYSYEEFSTINVNDSSVITNTTYIYSVQDTLQLNPIDTIYTDSTIYFVSTDSVSTPYSGKSSAQYLSIPIQLGYVFTFNKIMVGIQAKVRYNILINANGQYYQNNSVFDFDKTNSIYRKSYIDLALKTDLYYQIFEKLYLNGSVMFTPQLTNTFQNLSIERKLQYLHFGLGLSLKF